MAHQIIETSQIHRLFVCNSYLCKLKSGFPRCAAEFSGGSIKLLCSNDFVGVEAMAVGVPVVASKTGGLTEIIRDQLDGFLVPPGDAGALSSKLDLLLKDSELRRRMGVSGRERFMTHFEQSRVIPQQADWFEKAADTAVHALAERMLPHFT